MDQNQAIQTPNTIELIANIESSRLDIYLASLDDLQLSRAQVKRLIESGGITVNDKTDVKPRQKVCVKDKIKIIIPRTREHKLEPRYVELDIVYEDDDLIVINKQVGLVVHPGAGTKEATLIEGLLYYLDKKGVQLEFDDEIRPGIVHRLDKDTSGLLVCAKNEYALKSLSKQFHDKTNSRIYVALIAGNLSNAQMNIESYLYRDPNHRLKFKSMLSTEYARLYSQRADEIQKKFKYAKSKFELLHCFADKISLVKVELSTGRTHQIRIHCAYDLASPIIGDALYAHKFFLPKSVSANIVNFIANVSRQMLHAETLGFKHPRTGEDLSFKVAPPKDFLTTIAMLEKI